MQSGYDPRTLLQRVLLLERQQGFHDRAAVGGLSSFVQQQIARSGEQAPGVLKSVASLLHDYGISDRRNRESAVSAALHILLTQPSNGPGGTVPNTAPIDAGRVTSEDANSGTDSTGVEHPPARTSSLPRPRRHLSIVHLSQELDESVAGLKGMRKPMVLGLEKLGVVTIRDLLHFFPRTHYDYTDTRSISRLRLGQKTTLVGTIKNVRNNRTPRGAVITTAAVADDTGTVAVRWFNQQYLVDKLPVGTRIAVSGEPDVFNGLMVFQPRDFELIDASDLTHTARLVPIYPLTRGLHQRSLRQAIRRTLDEYVVSIEDFVPEDVQQALQLPGLSDAIYGYHFPEDEGERTACEQRLAFDELLMVQLGLLMRKQDWQQPLLEVRVPIDHALLQRFCSSLPFTLTHAQRRVIMEVLDDMNRATPMSRLLQGDVGSGKTVVAAAALLACVQTNKQAVVMAPTEILAEQHYHTIGSLLEPFDVSCRLITGSTPRGTRSSLYEGLRRREVQVVVGTHTLIQDAIEFSDLGLAITDEQHRFGVEQRATLRRKGFHPHILAMTATPIPRTLAMTIYGDLDVSSIDEMPPGRVPPITTWAQKSVEAYRIVREEVGKGHQAFVICPVIDESIESDMRSVVAEHKELEKLTFPDLRVGLLHGRMKAAEKEKTLSAFRQCEYHILVATSVVEVGIDIPNATVMVIRDAHRFGLAQLHQFRGRVGRGGHQSYCVLLSESQGEEARERLEAMTSTHNGFELAEQDLRLRGPGEFWGTRQSGLPELRVAQLGDLATIQLARQAATEIIKRDPQLDRPEHVALKQQVHRFWSHAGDLS